MRSRPATTTRSTGRRRGADADHPGASGRAGAIRPSSSRRRLRRSRSRSASVLRTRLRCTRATSSRFPPPCRPSRPLDPRGLSEGLPVGLQLIGPQFGENLLFRVGHALEQALGSTPCLRGGARDLGTGDRPRSARPSEDAGRRSSAAARSGSGRPENTQTCPVCLAFPGTLPVVSLSGDRVDGQARACARLRDRRARRLLPEELLLLRQPQGLSDLSV